MGKSGHFVGIALTDCASHYISWLKASFGEIVLFCDGPAGQGGSVGWSPREQFSTALWGFHQVGEVAECAFFALPGAGADAGAWDWVLDVAFGAEAPFRGYTEVRLVALPLPQHEEVAEMRQYANWRAANAATEELMLRLSMRSQD